MTLMSSGFSNFVACSAIPLGSEAKLPEKLAEVMDPGETAQTSAFVY